MPRRSPPQPEPRPGPPPSRLIGPGRPPRHPPLGQVTGEVGTLVTPTPGSGVEVGGGGPREEVGVRGASRRPTPRGLPPDALLVAVNVGGQSIGPAARPLPPGPHRRHHADGASGSRRETDVRGRVLTGCKSRRPPCQPRRSWSSRELRGGGGGRRSCRGRGRAQPPGPRCTSRPTYGRSRSSCPLPHVHPTPPCGTSDQVQDRHNRPSPSPGQTHTSST